VCVCVCVSELLVKNCCIKCLVLLLTNGTAAERRTRGGSSEILTFCWFSVREWCILVVFSQPSASSSASCSDCNPPLNVDCVVYGMLLSAFTDSWFDQAPLCRFARRRTLPCLETMFYWWDHCLAVQLSMAARRMSAGFSFLSLSLLYFIYVFKSGNKAHNHTHTRK